VKQLTGSQTINIKRLSNKMVALIKYHKVGHA